MSKIILTKEEFIYYIDELQKLHESSEKLNDALFNYDECSDFSGFSNFRALSLVTDLLEKLMDDPKDEYGYSTITYFTDELEYGTKWHEGCFTEADGTPIDISTSEKLYQYLVKEHEE